MINEIIYACERNYLEQYLKQRTSCNAEDFREIKAFYTEPLPYAGSDEAVNEIYKVDGDTAHIKIEGKLSADGADFWDRFFGFTGCSYNTLSACFEKANKDNQIKQVILHIDSPGGEIGGCDETWQKLKELSENKPVITHVKNICASAAYWIAMPSKRILASSPTDRIGSIGVLVVAIDTTGADERSGIKDVIITSANAPLKTPDASAPEFRTGIRKQIDALERIFYDRVAQGRGVSNKHIAEHFGKGGLMVAKDPSSEHEDAIRAGMIDGLIMDLSAKADENKKQRMVSMDLEQEVEKIRNRLDDIEDEIESMLDEAETDESDEKDDDKEPEGSSKGGKNIMALKKKVEKLTAIQKQHNILTASVKRIIPFMTGEVYPSSIKALAGEVLEGKKSIEAFDAAVAVYDATEEGKRSKEAQAETKEISGIAAEAPNFKNPADEVWNAAIADAKARKEKAKKEVA